MKGVKGISTLGWIVIVIAILIALLIAMNMWTGTQTHPFWEVR